MTKENLHAATMEIGIFILGSNDDRVLREMLPDLPPRATAHYRVAKKPARIVCRASLDVTFVMFCADRKPVETDLALGRRLAIPIACNDAPQIRGSHAGGNQGARCSLQAIRFIKNAHRQMYPAIGFRHCHPPCELAVREKVALTGREARDPLALLAVVPLRQRLQGFNVAQMDSGALRQINQPLRFHLGDGAADGLDGQAKEISDVRARHGEFDHTGGLALAYSPLRMFRSDRASARAMPFRRPRRGDQLVAMLQSEPITLITLDLGLGGEDGLEVARRVRARHNLPIVMISGKGDTIDRVVGLELGADDYITKPFQLREVLARIRAVLRRYEIGLAAAAPPEKHTEAYRFEDWVLDIARREVTRKGNIHELTTAEFNLLEIFVKRPGRVLSRDNIMDLLKGAEWSPVDRTIDNLVARLRKKIEADSETPRLVKTVRGIGYVFTADVQRG